MSNPALDRYLRTEAGRRFELGSADCVTLAADWVRECRGVDPMAYCRGYRGRAQAEALLANSWGGLARVVGRGLRQAGCHITRTPQPGDVAVLALPGVAICGIRSARGWVLRLDDGLALLPPDRVRVLAAWSV